MLRTKVNILILLFLFVATQSFAQEVSLVCNGEGASKGEAVKNALRSAVEQTFGAFVSSNTEVVNDELIRDEIVSISRGNIKNFKEISYIDEGEQKRVTLEATVSVDNLINYAKNKGMSTDLAGTALAANFKLRQLYLANGAKAMLHLFRILSRYAEGMYDFSIQTKEPIVQSHDELVFDLVRGTNINIKANDVLIDVTVDYELNQNGVEFYKTYKETVRTIENSINSVKIQGSYKNESNWKVIEFYKDFIEKLPKIMAHNFDVVDNLKDSVTYDYDMKKGLSQRAVGVRVIRTDYYRLPKECKMNPDIYNDTHEVYYKTGYYEGKLPYTSLDERVPLPRVGQVNGSIRFTIVYTMDKISKVTKIEVSPCK